MRRAWKIALPVTCAVLIGGTIAFELVHRHHLERERLAQEAQGYRVRAEKGDAEAEFHLCSMYRVGQGVPQSYAEAIRWCRKAADQNYAKAQYGVGYLYYYGYGVDGDFTEALRWFHLAANQNDLGAQNEIGIAYEVGNGVAPDYGKAVRWYRLAADQGFAPAQYNLGRMYAHGYGVSQDRVEAREWITRAADRGYGPAKQMLGRAWPKLGTAQKIQIIIPLIVGILFILPSRSPNPEVRSRIRRTTRQAGLGLLFSVAVSLLSYAFAGILEPPYVSGAFGFARNFVGGVIVSILLQIVWRNSAKWSLSAAGILFIALNGIALAHGLNRLPTDATIRLLFSVNGMPLGLGITSAVLLLRSKRGGETGGPSGSDEIAGAADGEPAHT
jgi:tetratricopeptide (TPR) repeat protein